MDTLNNKVGSLATRFIEVGDNISSKEQVLEAIAKARENPRISDIHLDRNEPLGIRIDGAFQTQSTTISKAGLDDFIAEHRPNDWEAQLQATGAYTTIVHGAETGRLRLTVLATRNGHVAAIRLLPDEPPTLADLSLPGIFSKISTRRSGLSIVAGPTGAGKSTALAAVAEEVNLTRRELIYTIDDAQEYIFKNKRSRFRQIAVGAGLDVPTYEAALGSQLRGDPNKIIVSECRTPDALRGAIMLAESGRHVLITIHLESGTSVVDRVVGAFPAQEQANIRIMLAGVLQDVIYMRLPVRREATKQFGRVPACEVLTKVDGLTTAILTDASGGQKNTESTEAALRNYITSHRDDGMMLLEDHLAKLVEEQVITKESAYEEAIRPDLLAQKIGSREAGKSSMFRA
jgi:twitching motility protein PilT